MIVYAESSAILAWLLGEPQQATIRDLLATSERVVASTLTALECSRALSRGLAGGQITRSGAQKASRLLDHAATGWTVLEMTGRVLERARRRFPLEPVRTLDALHLATAVVFGDALGAITVVTLDKRVRENALALGLAAAP